MGQFSGPSISRGTGLRVRCSRVLRRLLLLLTRLDAEVLVSGEICWRANNMAHWGGERL